MADHSLLPSPFYALCGLHEKMKDIIIEANTLQKLLGEVLKTDLMGDTVAWRRICLNVNQCLVKKKYDSPISYGGEQRRLFCERNRNTSKF